MATVKSTDESFDQLVKDNKILICDFWADWCKPCHMVAPVSYTHLRAHET